MNNQIVVSMVAVMMAAGAGCASQATENPKSQEEVVAALKLEGATEFHVNAAGATCYRPAYCKAGQVWTCCYAYPDLVDSCGNPVTY